MEKQQPTHEVRIFLISLVNHAVEMFLHNNIFLDRLEQNQLSLTQWKIFAVSRCLSTKHFETLLEVAAEKAELINMQELYQVIKANLRDELGADEQGKISPPRAHSTWRKDFYSAIGVTQKDFDTSTSAAAKVYCETIQSLLTEGDAFVLAGAILISEAIIPREFTKIKTGRDKMFPFLPEKARVYIDDHITHDAQSHYPDMLTALQSFATNDTIRQKIKHGVEIVGQAKKQFYQQLMLQICDDRK